MTIDTMPLKKALFALDSSIEHLENPSFFDQLDPDAKNTFSAGVIQHFEFSYELCWKLIKRWLELNFPSTLIDGFSIRTLYRTAQEHLLIKDVENWMDYHQARNLTSHTYNEETALKVINSSKNFLPDAKLLLEALNAQL